MGKIGKNAKFGNFRLRSSETIRHAKNLYRELGNSMTLVLQHGVNDVSQDCVSPGMSKMSV